MSRRVRNGFAVLMLGLASACGGGEIAATTATTVPPASSTAAETTHTTVPASTSSLAEDPGAPVDTTTTTLDPGAAGDFDDLYLILGPGQQFVPLDDPVMVPAAEVTWLEPDSIILGVVSGDAAHAYPADMMAYHHISNTTIAGEPYLVTY